MQHIWILLKLSALFVLIRFHKLLCCPAEQSETRCRQSEFLRYFPSYQSEWRIGIEFYFFFRVIFIRENECECHHLHAILGILSLKKLFVLALNRFAFEFQEEQIQQSNGSVNQTRFLSFESLLQQLHAEVCYQSKILLTGFTIFPTYFMIQVHFTKLITAVADDLLILS